MENTDQKGLSFPQRNWLLLCILVAILSPIVVHWVQAGAHKEAYRESTEIKPVNSETGGASAGGAGTPAAGTPAAGTSPGVQGGTAADSGKKDSSYKVATPPTDSAKKSGGASGGKKN